MLGLPAPEHNMFAFRSSVPQPRHGDSEDRLDKVVNRPLLMTCPALDEGERRATIQIVSKSESTPIRIITMPSYSYAAWQKHVSVDSATKAWADMTAG
jgi:hypothetical protein